MTIEVMKQALEALETCMYPQQKQIQAITSLRQAIEQAEKQKPVAWIELWHGSGPDRGWWVWEAGLTHGNMVAYIGEGEFAERLASLIVEKHNTAIHATPPATPAQEPKMYEDWYDSASCGHCGMVNGHTQHCRTVTRTAATKISKHEPIIDLGGHAGTYGPVIDHSCKDTYELIMKWADIYAAQTGNLYAQAAQDPSKVARMADERTMLACVVAQAFPPPEPDLLNALKRIVDEPNNTMSDGKTLKEIIRIARAAIAKETGEKK